MKSSLKLPEVALFSEEYPPFMFGGIASVCHDLAYALSRKGVPTTVFCGRAEKMTIEHVNSHLKIVRLPCFDFPPRFIWFQAQNFTLFSRLLRNYSVIHIVNPEAGASIAYFGKKSHKKVVTSIHGVYLYALKKYLSSPFGCWTIKDTGYPLFTFPMNTLSYGVCLKYSDHVAVCSRSTLAELKSIYPKLEMSKVSVIPNGINMEAFNETSDSQDCLSVISYSRLMWVKGLNYLITAVAQLTGQFPGLRVKIFGDGPFKDRLKAMISNLRLNENVDLRSFLPRHELFKEIRRSNFVVLPSLQEAQPISFLEAMACKKPVIAFDFPFSRELIRNMFNGLLARPADVEDLADKMRLVLADHELSTRLGQNGYEYVKERHDWNTIVEKYIELYTA